MDFYNIVIVLYSKFSIILSDTWCLNIDIIITPTFTNITPTYKYYIQVSLVLLPYTMLIDLRNEVNVKEKPKKYFGNSFFVNIELNIDLLIVRLKHICIYFEIHVPCILC